MTTRRQVIHIGLAAAVSLVGFPAGETGAADTPVLSLDLYVFDDRYPEAAALARQAARLGVPVHAASDDLTDLWRQELRPRWRTAPTTLAGVTTRGSLFVLETLAADHRMAVVSRRDFAAGGQALQEPLVAWIIAPRTSVATML